MMAPMPSIIDTEVLEDFLEVASQKQIRRAAAALRELADGADQAASELDPTAQKAEPGRDAFGRFREGAGVNA